MQAYPLTVGSKGLEAGEDIAVENGLLCLLRLSLGANDPSRELITVLVEKGELVDVAMRSFGS